jgi:hypothetical protein
MNGMAEPTVVRRTNVGAIVAMTDFIKRLLNPEDLGHAVTKEVRDEARRALGMPPCEGH